MLKGKSSQSSALWARITFIISMSLVLSISCVAFGSVAFSFREIFEALMAREGVHWTVISELRWPRVLVAFTSGALLAMSGCLLQALLRNPLADPYIFGVSSGASLGVLGATIFALPGFVTIFGFGGAALVVLMVAYFAHHGADWSPYRLILTGVMVSAGLNAIISLILVLAPPVAMKGMLFWMMGDLTYAHPRGMVGLFMLMTLTFGVFYGRALDVLTLGEERAKALGVPVKYLEYAIYLLASAAAALVVVEAGAIGFVGLVVPHILRMMGVWQHRYLVMVSAFFGGALVTVADTFARSLWSPVQLPVGVVTAMIGVPILIFLLNKPGYVERR